MPRETTIALFAVAVLLLTATPGPGLLYLMTRTVSQGRRAGFASLFGIESGEIVWMAAAATGVGALLAASTAAFTIVRWAGAAYLVWLGIQRWRHSERVTTPPRAGALRIYAQGLVTQLLNPKVVVFFVALLPQFINPAEPVAPQIAVLGAVYIGIALVVDTTYVLASAFVRGRLVRSAGTDRRVGRLSAATYVGLGVAAAVARVNTSA